MKFVLLLVFVAAASAQFFNRFRGRPFQFRAPPNRFARPQQRPQAPQNNVRGFGGGGGDDTFGSSEYHFSWAHDGGRKYTGGGARGYCNGLGGGWQAVSIEDRSESDFINRVIGSNGQAYIWTSGVKQGRGFVWGNGRPVGNVNWSRTGGRGSPQPDNRDGNENCLAILNQFYPNDGITWHDVGCSHTKPVICERPLNRG